MDDRNPVNAQDGGLQWWRIGRASLGFILDTIAASRGAGDIIDPLILSVIIEANLALINQDPALQHRYASLDQPPPDELRRPVSISAVAASLRLPYETVRRRVTRLVENGACEMNRQGVTVPERTVNNPFYLITATVRYERLKQLYFDLKALGALRDLPQPAQVPEFDAPPVRIANRVIAEYILRVIDSIMRTLGDPLTGLVLLEMARANTLHLTAEDLAMDRPIPDEMRRPIRTLALAKRLGLPSETVRRHVAHLEAAGYSRRMRQGRLAALEQMGQGDGGGLSENLRNIHRMFVKLATLGVVAFWESNAGPPINLPAPHEPR